MMKWIKNKKSAGPLVLPLAIIVLLWIVVAMTGISIAGIIKFMFTDKTPLILGGVLLFFILLGQKKKN